MQFFLSDDSDWEPEHCDDADVCDSDSSFGSAFVAARRRGGSSVSRPSRSFLQANSVPGPSDDSLHIFNRWYDSDGESDVPGNEASLQPFVTSMSSSESSSSSSFCMFIFRHRC